MNPVRYTPELLAERRAKIQEQLDEKTEHMRRCYNSLFAPAPQSRNTVTKYVNYAEKAWALFDGMRTGYKLLGSVADVFHIRRRKRRR